MQIKDEGLPIKQDAQLKIRHRLFLEGNYFVDLQPGHARRARARGRRHGARRTRPPRRCSSARCSPRCSRETREDLRTFLREYSSCAQGRGRARASTRRSSTGRTRTATRSQVNDATLGQKRHDLGRVLERPGPGVRRAVEQRGRAEGAGHRPQPDGRRVRLARRTTSRRRSRGCATCSARAARRSRRSTRRCPRSAASRATRCPARAPRRRRSTPRSRSSSRRGGWCPSASWAGSRASCARRCPTWLA